MASKTAERIELDDLKAAAARDPETAYRAAGYTGDLKRQGGNLAGLCPFRDEKTGSFTVFSDGGFKCFGCGASGSIIDFHLRLNCGIDDPGPDDLEPENLAELGRLLGVAPRPAPNRDDEAPWDLAAYAAHVLLPPDTLRKWGMSDRDRGGVLIAYRDEDGKLLRNRVRVDGGKRWWERDADHGGEKSYVYGLDHLADDDGPLLVVEGESDCQVAWHCGLRALGAPGQSIFKPEWLEYLPPGTEVLYVLREPDATLPETVAKAAREAETARSLPNPPEVRAFTLPQGDLLDVWRGVGCSPHALREAVEEALGAAQAVSLPEPKEKGSASSDSRGFNLTDLGNSERIVALHGGEMRFCHPWGGRSQSAQRGWVVWDGTRWREDDAGLALARAKLLPRAIYEEAAACEDSDRRKALGGHAHRTEARARMVNALALAQSSLPLLPDELNRDGWLLNVANGTIDLRTGDLRPHRREDMITKIANTTYDPDAKAPRWERFLLEIMGGNEDLVAFLQRAFGYSLIGNSAEHVMFFLHGPEGRNGKSTLLGTGRAALGDYAMEASHDLLTTMGPNQSRHPTIIMDLFGQRFVSTIEVEKGAHLAEALMTWLTGGDTITGHRMRENEWHFEPTHTLWMAATNKPSVQARAAAVWERIKLVPFEIRFGDGPGFDFPADLGLKQALRGEDDDRSPDRGELPGVLRWGVEGCLTWQRDGLAVPGEVRNAVQDYREEQDELAPFLDEECVIDEAATAKFADLYERYTEWCRHGGEKPLTKTKLGRELTERGFASAKKPDAWRLGIGLRDPDGVRRDDDGAASQDHC